MSDDKKPNHDDVPHVTSLDEITADGPVLWTSDAMVTQGGGAIFAVPEGAEPSISDTVSDSYFGTVGPREIPWPLPPRFARGLLQRDVPRRLWFLDESYTPPTIAHTVVIDGGPSIITDGTSERPPSILLADTASGSVSAAAICLPLPSVPFDFAAHRGRLVRDDAARGWRFEPSPA